MSEFFLALFVVGMIAYTIAAINAKKARVQKMDDEDPFDGEWKDGDPNAPVSPEAKPFKVEDAGWPDGREVFKKVKFNVEED